MEAKDEKPTSPSSYQFPCACDLGSLLNWLIIIISADIHQVLTLCQALCHMLSIYLLFKPLKQPLYYAHFIDEKTETG